MHLCSVSVAYACPHHNLTPPWTTPFTVLTSANCSPTWCRIHLLPSAPHSAREHLWSAKLYWMWAFAHSSRLQRWTVVEWRLLTIMQTSFPEMVSSFFGSASRLLQQLSGWLLWVCCVLKLWGHLDVLPNFMKHLAEASGTKIIGQ